MFEGDELWNIPNNFKFTALRIKINHLGENDFLTNGMIGGWLSDCSWNPPKPKTVMVELTVEDAKLLRDNFEGRSFYGIVDACKKSLEAL